MAPALTAAEKATILAGTCDLDERSYSELYAQLLYMIVLASGGGGGSKPTTGAITPTVTIATSTGATSSGAYALTFQNTGSSNAVVAGQILEPSQSVSFESYLDPTVPVFNRLNSIAYDATGTSLYITETP